MACQSTYKTLPSRSLESIWMACSLHIIRVEMKEFLDEGCSLKTSEGERFEQCLLGEIFIVG